jgi:hypothetical protein
MVKTCFTTVSIPVNGLVIQSYLKIQKIIEETKEIKKEKAIKANGPPREIGGMENQTEWNPANTKLTSLNPGTTNVTRYNVTAYVTHLKMPKVTRFRGKRRRFNIG